MTIADGPQWSPDGGKLWAKNNVVYWEDGDVTDLNEKGPFCCLRLMPGGYEHNEDYSAWTTEHRAQVWAASQARYAAAQQAQEQSERRTSLLRASARLKLTPEEAEACQLYEE